jgi:hydroxymethylpyrimidine kinase/phosphomethylpyrimidine kinase
LSENSIQVVPVALTIAGFDPSGGAGVLADARTFAAFGFRASAAITSITFQNRARVFGVMNQTGDSVREQILPLLEGATFACAKTGMLPTRQVVLEVARLFQESELPGPVVDPVIISTSGHRLMEEDAVEVLIDQLLPLARLITPNIPEAERLAGLSITSEKEMRQAASRIRKLGARAVLIKGGHLKRQQEAGGRRQEQGDKEVNETSNVETSNPSEESIDVLDDDGKVKVFRASRIPNGDLQGSGCILSAAIAAGLGRGESLEESVGAAKTFVLEEIRSARRF